MRINSDSSNEAHCLAHQKHLINVSGFIITRMNVITHGQNHEERVIRHSVWQWPSVAQDLAAALEGNFPRVQIPIVLSEQLLQLCCSFSGSACVSPAGTFVFLKCPLLRTCLSQGLITEPESYIIGDTVKEKE